MEHGLYARCTNQDQSRRGLAFWLHAFRPQARAIQVACMPAALLLRHDVNLGTVPDLSALHEGRDRLRGGEPWRQVRWVLFAEAQPLSAPGSEDSVLNRHTGPVDSPARRSFDRGVGRAPAWQLGFIRLAGPATASQLTCSIPSLAGGMLGLTSPPLEAGCALGTLGCGCRGWSWKKLLLAIANVLAAPCHGEKVPASGYRCVSVWLPTGGLACGAANIHSRSFCPFRFR